MAAHREQRPRTTESRRTGLAGAAGTPWQRLRAWLFGTREEIDQEGLLARRTLLVRPPRPPERTGSGERDDDPPPQRDEPR